MSMTEYERLQGLLYRLPDEPKGGPGTRKISEI